MKNNLRRDWLKMKNSALKSEIKKYKVDLLRLVHNVKSGVEKNTSLIKFNRKNIAFLEMCIMKSGKINK